MQTWNGNTEAAKQIFQFFETKYTSREHDGSLLFEGRHGQKLIVLTCPEDVPTTLGIETRTPKTCKITGGALLNSCKNLRLEVRDGEKFAIVYTSHGDVVISKWGIISTLG